jgi:hypothetical protein
VGVVVIVIIFGWNMKIYTKIKTKQNEEKERGKVNEGR